MVTQNSCNFGTGATGQLLTSNGPGVAPTFQTSTSFATVNIQTFTSNGTYTPTSGMKYCVIQCVGGGGGGGGAPDTVINTLVSVGGGGQSGGYAVGVFTAADIGASKAVTVGTGGTGGNGVSGTNGGNTSVGTLISIQGGSPGSASGTGATASANGGNGAMTSPGSSYFSTGEFGGTGSIANLGNGTAFTFSGAGGSSILGAGAPQISSPSALTANGTAGGNYGGGGAGAANFTTGSAKTGGNGAPGIVIITEYI